MKCLAHITDNPNGHDWVLVDTPGTVFDAREPTLMLLWACPCGEFKWTSYAEWEGHRSIADMTQAEVREREAKVPGMVTMTSDPNQGESTAAGHITT